MANNRRDRVFISDILYSALMPLTLRYRITQLEISEESVAYVP